MEFNNSVYPTKEQMDGFLEGNDDSPISMVNLLKFKDKAEYEDGRETNLTGAEAYAIYSKEVVKHLKSVGAEWIYSGDVTRLMLGDIEELWDMVAIARYPSKKAMLDMIMSPEYIESSIHRTAGLAGQLNIETK
ncbi:DUF1330 domain-containing protein [Gammaproteobacteria bacterium]|nr:DUF1330 domain-containing protein [Gammaproteobacteria bacterium]